MPHGDRSGVVIEPWLTDQWYVNAAKLAEPAIAAVERARPIRAGAVDRDLFRVDAQHPALVHLAPALVGPSDPGLVRADGKIFVAMEEAEAAAAAAKHTARRPS